MPRSAAVQISNEIVKPEMVQVATIAKMNLARKKLARLRANLKAMRGEISDRLFVNVKDCRKNINSTMNAIGEINAAFNSENK